MRPFTAVGIPHMSSIKLSKKQHNECMLTIKPFQETDVESLIFYSSSGVLTLDTVHRWLYSAIVVGERRGWSAQMQPVLIRGQLNCFCIQKFKIFLKYEVVETSLSLSIVGMQPSPWPASCLICSSATPWTSAPSSLRRRWNRPGGLNDFLLNQDVKWHTKLFERTFFAVIFVWGVVRHDTSTFNHHWKNYFKVLPPRNGFPDQLEWWLFVCALIFKSIRQLSFVGIILSEQVATNEVWICSQLTDLM